MLYIKWLNRSFGTAVRTAAFRNRTAVSRENRIRYRGSEPPKQFLHLRTAVLPRDSAVPRPAAPRVTLYFTQTWLCNKFTNCMLDPKSHFNIDRRDRTFVWPGGGVLIFIHKSLQSSLHGGLLMVLASLTLSLLQPIFTLLQV